MWCTVFTRVFGKGRYVLLFLGVFILSLSLVLLLPQFNLVSKVLISSDITVFEKFNLISLLYGAIVTNFTWFSASYTLTLLTLFSMNVTLLVFYIRRVQKQLIGSKRQHLSGLAGSVSGVLGIGCAACGSVILTGFATSIGAAGFLLLLPLRGGEFALIGILLLFISIKYLVKKINDPLVCPIQH